MPLYPHQEYDEYQEEWYDEMTEGPSVAAAKPPPPPPNTGRALPPPPAADVGKAQRERRPMPLPKEPSSPDEIEEVHNMYIQYMYVFCPP